MSNRTKTGLNLADRNSYVKVEENINDNLLKIDDDVDATWGGLYGGRIQDETITKEVGKRYIDEFNKKAYICRKPSNVNTEDAYMECNVVSNLDKLQNLASNIDTGLGYLRIFNYISISGKVNLTNGTSTRVKYNHFTNGTIGVQLIASNPDCNYNKLTVVEESSLGFTIIHPNTYGTLAINYTAVCFL